MLDWSLSFSSLLAVPVTTGMALKFLSSLCCSGFLIFLPKATQGGGPPGPVGLALVNCASFLLISHFSARASTLPPSTSRCCCLSWRNPPTYGMAFPGASLTLVPGGVLTSSLASFSATSTPCT